MIREAPLRLSRAGLVLGVVAVLGACAQIPIVPSFRLLRTNPASQQITLYDAHGALSARKSRALLDQMLAQAPNAEALARHLAVEQAVAQSPLYVGDSVRVLRDGKQTFPAIFAAIAGAKRYLYLEYYIFEDVSSQGGDLGDLLVSKAHAGVQVSVIYDAAGSIGTPAAFVDRLRAGGVRVLEYNPVDPFDAKRHYSPNSRDHRKLLVADGTLAIVGGVNLSTTYESDGQPPQQVWHDIDVEIHGPVVTELGTLFRKHWLEQTGEALPVPEARSQPRIPGNEIVRILGSSPSRLSSRYYVTVVSAIRNAKSSIWIVAAYFVPTLQELRSLKAAARRGVDVRLILPAHSDWPPVIAIQRSHYSGLLRAGVKIYEREGGILHSKSMVVDGVWSLVGSSNFDQRSVLFNDEVDAVILGRSTASQLTGVFQGYLSDAQPITRQDVRHFGLRQRLRAAFWSLWQKLL